MKNLLFLLLKILGLSSLLIMLNTQVTANSFSKENRLAEFQENQKLWRSQAIDTYQFIYQQQCFCPPPANTPLQVSIQNNQIIQVINLKTGKPLEESDLKWVKSIDELFNIIQDAIDRNADELSVTYDSELGYPTRIAIDYEEILADDEQTYLAQELVKKEK